MGIKDIRNQLQGITYIVYVLYSLIIPRNKKNVYCSRAEDEYRDMSNIAHKMV